MVRSAQAGSSSVYLVGILALLVGAGVFYYAFVKAETPEVVTPAPPPPLPKPEQPKQIAPIKAPAPSAGEPKPAGTEIVYPDGSRYPNLNGVKIGPAMLWPKDRPFSPVNGTLTDSQNIEWYTHVDGSRSTVMIDKNRKEPVSIVANPTAVLPVADEDLKMLEEQRKREAEKKKTPGGN